MNTGTCALPPASDEAVVVVEAATTFDCAEPTRFNVLPVPEAVTPVPASAAFNCKTTDAVPPEKLMPICLGLAFGAFASGSAVGSVTLTIDIWR